MNPKLKPFVYTIVVSFIAGAGLAKISAPSEKELMERYSDEQVQQVREYFDGLSKSAE